MRKKYRRHRQCGKVVKNTISPFLRENQHFFRQINVFAKEVTEELISRKMSVMIAFYSTTHIVGDRTFSVISHLLFHDILTKIRKNNYKSPNYYLQIDFTRNIKMWSPPEICKTQRPYCAHCLGTLAWRKKNVLVWRLLQESNLCISWLKSIKIEIFWLGP